MTSEFRDRRHAAVFLASYLGEYVRASAQLESSLILNATLAISDDAAHSTVSTAVTEYNPLWKQLDSQSGAWIIEAHRLFPGEVSSAFEELVRQLKRHHHSKTLNVGMRIIKAVNRLRASPGMSETTRRSVEQDISEDVRRLQVAHGEDTTQLRERLEKLVGAMSKEVTPGDSIGLRVFLCHATPDKKLVRELYTRLQHWHCVPWLDEKDILPGQTWDDEIRDAVRATDVVVVCLSRGSVTREGYVQKEIRLALDVASEKPDGTIFIIPARLEDCPLPRMLERWHAVNLFEPGGYDRLKAALEKRYAEILEAG